MQRSDSPHGNGITAIVKCNTKTIDDSKASVPEVKLQIEDGRIATCNIYGDFFGVDAKRMLRRP